MDNAGKGYKTDKIGGNDLIVEVPKAVVRGIHLEQNDMFLCEFKKHFDSNKRLIAEINEHMKLYCRPDYWTESCYLKDPHYIRLTDLYLMEK